MGCGASLDSAKSISKVDNNVWKGVLNLKICSASII